MTYNGIELEEMTPKKWNGKSREMLVWNPLDNRVTNETIIGYKVVSDDVFCWMDKYGNLWKYCAEIPQEESDYSIDDLINLITKRCEATTWYPVDSCIVEYLKSIKEIKEENEELKTKVNKLKNSCSYQTYCTLCNVKAKLEEKIENLKKAKKLNKEEQIKWLNNEIVNLQYELSQPCINYDYKAKQLAMYTSFWELIYETK